MEFVMDGSQQVVGNKRGNEIRAGAPLTDAEMPQIDVLPRAKIEEEKGTADQFVNIAVDVDGKKGYTLIPITGKREVDMSQSANENKLDIIKRDPVSRVTLSKTVTQLFNSPRDEEGVAPAGKVSNLEQYLGSRLKLDRDVLSRPDISEQAEQRAPIPESNFIDDLGSRSQLFSNEAGNENLDDKINRYQMPIIQDGEVNNRNLQHTGFPGYISSHDKKDEQGIVISGNIPIQEYRDEKSLPPDTEIARAPAPYEVSVREPTQSEELPREYSERAQSKSSRMNFDVQDRMTARSPPVLESWHHESKPAYREEKRIQYQYAPVTKSFESGRHEASLYNKQPRIQAQFAPTSKSVESDMERVSMYNKEARTRPQIDPVSNTIEGDRARETIYNKVTNRGSQYVPISRSIERARGNELLYTKGTPIRSQFQPASKPIERGIESDMVYAKDSRSQFLPFSKTIPIERDNDELVYKKETHVRPQLDLVSNQIAERREGEPIYKEAYREMNMFDRGKLNLSSKDGIQMVYSSSRGIEDRDIGRNLQENVPPRRPGLYSRVNRNDALRRQYEMEMKEREEAESARQSNLEKMQNIGDIDPNSRSPAMQERNVEFNQGYQVPRKIDSLDNERKSMQFFQPAQKNNVRRILSPRGFTPLSDVDSPLPVRIGNGYIGGRQMLSRRNEMPLQRYRQTLFKRNGVKDGKREEIRKILQKLGFLVALGDRLNKARNTRQYSNIVTLAKNYLHRYGTNVTKMFESERIQTGHRDNNATNNVQNRNLNNTNMKPGNSDQNETEISQNLSQNPKKSDDMNLNPSKEATLWDLKMEENNTIPDQRKDKDSSFMMIRKSQNGTAHEIAIRIISNAFAPLRSRHKQKMKFDESNRNIKEEESNFSVDKGNTETDVVDRNDMISQVENSTDSESIAWQTLKFTALNALKAAMEHEKLAKGKCNSSGYNMTIICQKVSGDGKKKITNIIHTIEDESKDTSNNDVEKAESSYAFNPALDTPGVEVKSERLTDDTLGNTSVSDVGEFHSTEELSDLDSEEINKPKANKKEKEMTKLKEVVDPDEPSNALNNNSLISKLKTDHETENHKDHMVTNVKENKMKGAQGGDMKINLVDEDEPDNSHIANSTNFVGGKDHGHEGQAKSKKYEPIAVNTTKEAVEKDSKEGNIRQNKTRELKESVDPDEPDSIRSNATTTFTGNEHGSSGKPNSDTAPFANKVIQNKDIRHDKVKEIKESVDPDEPDSSHSNTSTPFIGKDHDQGSSTKPSSNTSTFANGIRENTSNVIQNKDILHQKVKETKELVDPDEPTSSTSNSSALGTVKDHVQVGPGVNMNVVKEVKESVDPDEPDSSINNIKTTSIMDKNHDHGGLVEFKSDKSSFMNDIRDNMNKSIQNDENSRDKTKEVKELVDPDEPDHSLTNTSTMVRHVDHKGSADVESNSLKFVKGIGEGIQNMVQNKATSYRDSKNVELVVDPDEPDMMNSTTLTLYLANELNNAGDSIDRTVKMMENGTLNDMMRHKKLKKKKKKKKKNTKQSSSFRDVNHDRATENVTAKGFSPDISGNLTNITSHDKMDSNNALLENSPQVDEDEVAAENFAINGDNKEHADQISKVKEMLDDEEDRLRSSLTKKVEEIMEQYRKERAEFEKDKGIKTENMIKKEEKTAESRMIRKTFF